MPTRFTRAALAAPLAAITLQLGACATVARGPNAEMVVDTTPPGATITTDLLRRGEALGCAPTPCTFQVPRKKHFLMTITHPEAAPVEIGVVSRNHRESLNANLRGAGATGAASGVLLGSAVAGLGGAGGAVLAGAAAATAAVTAGVGAVSLGVDAMTGALKNPTPNPVILVLPEAGSEPVEHVTVERLRIFRMEGEAGRQARRDFKQAEKEARREAKRVAKAERRRAEQAAEEDAETQGNAPPLNDAGAPQTEIATPASPPAAPSTTPGAAR